MPVSTNALSRRPDAWAMPALLRASVGLHALAVAGTLADPQAWPWALASVALDHAVLTAAVLQPRSAWLGPNLRHLGAASARRGEIALTLDDGPDPEVTPAVLDLLEAQGARATFFCIAHDARRHPALTRRIVERGHSVQNHSLRHRHTFALMGPRGVAREVREAQQILEDITGTRPGCFRAPAGFRGPFLDPVLHERGLRLVSWTRRGFDTRDADAPRVLGRLARGLGGGDILLLHDGGSARATGRGPVVLDVLPALLDRMRRAGLHAVTLPQALLHADARVAA